MPHVPHCTIPTIHPMRFDQLHLCHPVNLLGCLLQLLQGNLALQEVYQLRHAGVEHLRGGAGMVKHELQGSMGM